MSSFRPLRVPARQRAAWDRLKARLRARFAGLSGDKARTLSAARKEIAFLRDYATRLEKGLVPPSGHIFGSFRIDPRWQGPRPADGAEVIWKSASERLLWAGTTREQAFLLEVNCLIRLNEVERDSPRRHFPVLLDIDPERQRFAMTRVGLPLTDLPAGPQTVVHDLGAQAACIVRRLERAGVVHLDLHRSGKNLAVDRTGTVSLIDFDVAALDGVAWSGWIRERLDRFQRWGGYERTQRRIIQLVAACPRIRLTGDTGR